MDLQEYFHQTNLTKTPRVGVHFEQKTTPDLLWCVALAILEATQRDRNMLFSDKEDIRSSATFNALMQDYFSKPPQAKAEEEYNKVSRYQLELLTFAGVLQHHGTRPKKYKIRRLDIVEYLGVNDLNAANFLTQYIDKFLVDNNLALVFDMYRNNPNQDNHLKAKDAYWLWAKANTAVKGENRLHTNRVFNKIFNVYCYKHRIPGEDSSNITSGPCPYSFLIYNRENFRDKDKPNGMTRNEYHNEVLKEINYGGVVDTLLRKAKEAIKEKYGYESEIKEMEWGYAEDRVVEVHHILPSHSYQQFSLAKENLIVLTPDQHRSFAHQGSYRTIEPIFQAKCLLTKLKNIALSLEHDEKIYTYEKFVEVVNACYNWDLESTIHIESLREKLMEKMN